MALNAHKIFTNNSLYKSNYLKSLNVDKEIEENLRGARDKIRKALSDGFKEWSSFIHEFELLEGFLQKSGLDTANPPALKPKFRGQGSFSYRTCNQPEQSPPQEVDLDDGLFLPVSFLDRDGNEHPVVVSAGYFKIVERILEPLCKQEGWELDTDKASCVRVKLPNNAHVDVALYAIPDQEFSELVESAIAKSMQSIGFGDPRQKFNESIELAEDLYSELRSYQIMLAHRSEGWKPSDPRELENWFHDALERHGEQLRRVCRYLKGWRDYKWSECRLSSIAIMSAIVTILDDSAVPAIEQDRDDLAIMAIADNLPTVLAGRIPNPVVQGQWLDEGWSHENRQDFIAAANELSVTVQNAIEVTDDPQKAIASLRAVFGVRIPNDPELILTERTLRSDDEAPSVLTSGLLSGLSDDAGVRDAVRKEGDGRFG